MPIPVDVMLNMNLYVDYQTLDQELFDELFFGLDGGYEKRTFEPTATDKVYGRGKGKKVKVY